MISLCSSADSDYVTTIHYYEVTLHRVNKSGRIRSKLTNYLLSLLYNSRDRLVILSKFESELVWFPVTGKHHFPQERLLTLIAAKEVRQQTTVYRKKCSIGEAQ
jgi:hypothetical protein